MENDPKGREDVQKRTPRTTGGKAKWSSHCGKPLAIYDDVTHLVKEKPLQLVALFVTATTGKCTMSDRWMTDCAHSGDSWPVQPHT